MEQFVFKLQSAFDNQKGTLIIQAEDLPAAFDKAEDMGYFPAEKQLGKKYTLETKHSILQNQLSKYQSDLALNTLERMGFDRHEMKRVSPVQSVGMLLDEGYLSDDDEIEVGSELVE